MKRLYYLLASVGIAALSLFLWAPRAYAQGPDIEICVAPQLDGNYVDVPTFSEDPIPGNGWSGTGTSFSFGANYARFGNTITGGTANLTKTLTLDDLHSASRVSITAQASSARTGSIIVTLAGAQQGSVATFDSTLQTLSVDLAQGTSYSQLLQLAGTSNGQLTIYEVALEPTSLITRTSEAFLDPDMNGIEWPSWFKIVGGAAISSSSRAVGGVFGFSPGNNQYGCSQIIFDTSVDVSNMITVSFNATGGGNTSTVNTAGAIVADQSTAASATYGTSINVSNGGPSPYQIGAQMNYTTTGGIGYFCLKMDVLGSSGQMQYDNFDIETCVSPTEFPCDTVVDDDFSTGDGWTLFNSTVITEGVLQVHQNALATQNLISITQTFPQYTVTVRAQSTAAGPLPLWLGFANSITEVTDYAVDFDTTGLSFNTLNGRLDSVEVLTETAFYTLTLVGPPLGIEKWFFITGAGDDEYGIGDIVEVDWVCVEGYGEPSVCVDPNNVIFDLNTGNNYGGLFEEQYGSSQGWTSLHYEDISVLTVENDLLALWQPLSNFSPDINVGLLASSGIYGFGDDSWVTARYNDPVIPANASVRAIFPTGAPIPTFELWLDRGGGWLREVEYTPDDTSSPVDDDHSVITVVLTPTNLVTAPVNIAVAMGLQSDFSILNAHRMGFDQIEVLGCFPGDPLTGACVVLDPDLDLGNGYPSTFYWSGTFAPGPGRADLNAGETIFQNVTPPRAATYQLEMLASAFLNDGPNCDFTIEVKDFVSTLVLSQQDVICKLGLVQTYTLQIDLPVDPVEILLRQNTGSLQLDYFCLSLPDEPNCLNINPVFVDGISGYTGDFTIASGQAVIAPSKSIAATGVRYGFDLITGTYQLDLIASPVSDTVDVRITNDNSPPTVSTPQTVISSTTTITHIIASDLPPMQLGPSIWNFNNPFEDDLIISQYCITQITSTIWYGGKTCDTVTNPDFQEGLNGWNVAGDVVEMGGWAIMAGGSLSQTISSLTEEITQTLEATLYWIARAPGFEPISATAIISSATGVFTFSHLFGGGLTGAEYFDIAEVTGDVQITLTGDPGLELDYACLLRGPYIRSAPPGSGEPPPIGEVSANCAPPPMMILSATLQSWLPSIWIWEAEPSNLETITAYSAAWLRYIGCFLTGYGQMVEDKFDEVIFWLKAIALLQGLDTLASILSALLDALDLLEQTLDDLIETLLGPIASIAYILGILALFLAALVGLILLIIGLVALIWAIPQEFWSSFTDALNSPDYIALPLPDSEAHPLYTILYGFQVINQTIGQTILFPITVIAIAIGSIHILLWTLRRFKVKL
jgi:hypothetical protein